MCSGSQRRDGGLGAFAVDPGDECDIDVVDVQQLMRGVVQRGADPGQEPFTQLRVGLGGGDQLELVALADLGQGVVDVLMGSAEDGDLHRFSSRVTRRPVRAAVVMASSRWTVAAPSAAEIAGSRSSRRAESTSLHCWI